MSSLDSGSPISLFGTPTSGWATNCFGTSSLSCNGAIRDFAPMTRKRKASDTPSEWLPSKPTRPLGPGRLNETDRKELSSLFAQTSNKLNALRKGATQDSPSLRSRLPPANIDSWCDGTLEGPAVADIQTAASVAENVTALSGVAGLTSCQEPAETRPGSSEEQDTNNGHGDGQGNIPDKEHVCHDDGHEDGHEDGHGSGKDDNEDGDMPVNGHARKHDCGSKGNSYGCADELIRIFYDPALDILHPQIAQDPVGCHIDFRVCCKVMDDFFAWQETKNNRVPFPGQPVTFMVLKSRAVLIEAASTLFKALHNEDLASTDDLTTSLCILEIADSLGHPKTASLAILRRGGPSSIIPAHLPPSDILMWIYIFSKTGRLASDHSLVRHLEMACTRTQVFSRLYDAGMPPHIRREIMPIFYARAKAAHRLSWTLFGILSGTVSSWKTIDPASQGPCFGQALQKLEATLEEYKTTDGMLDESFFHGVPFWLRLRALYFTLPCICDKRNCFYQSDAFKLLTTHLNVLTHRSGLLRD